MVPPALALNINTGSFKLSEHMLAFLSFLSLMRGNIGPDWNILTTIKWIAMKWQWWWLGQTLLTLVDNLVFMCWDKTLKNIKQMYGMQRWVVNYELCCSYWPSYHLMYGALNSWAIWSSLASVFMDGIGTQKRPLHSTFTVSSGHRLILGAQLTQTWPVSLSSDWK